METHIDFKNKTPLVLGEEALANAIILLGCILGAGLLMGISWIVSL